MCSLKTNKNLELKSQLVPISFVAQIIRKNSNNLEKLGFANLELFVPSSSFFRTPFIQFTDNSIFNIQSKHEHPKEEQQEDRTARRNF